MAKPNPRLRTARPKNAFTKPLTADFKGLFRALAKGIGHTAIGKWEELGTDTVEALSSLGLATEPEELAFLLLRRATTNALFELVGESASLALIEAKEGEDALLEKIDFTTSFTDVTIDRRFLDRPSELPLVEDIRRLVETWMELHGVTKPTASAIAHRFPSYFVYALNREWRKNAKSYTPLLNVIDTPFTKAGEREWAWAAYAALLRRRTQEGIFDEPFSLSQVFVPLNAYYPAESTRQDLLKDSKGLERRSRRIVVSLQNEMDKWLAEASGSDTIRVISGGPGSGKSSFLRIFAAQTAEVGKVRVLYVPLHLIDPTKDLVEEVGRFVRDEGVLLQNPLDPESPEPNLLIIFDGLDELASQGKVAAETARGFVREVERTTEKRNLQKLKLRILISGRELLVQENETEFRKARQVLTLLPYFVSKSRDDDHQVSRENVEYVDSLKLLTKDLRDLWWKSYGKLTGRNYQGLPEELSRRDLDEVTAQPLLNYLVALSLTRDKMDFARDINLNSVYADLVAAVHERGYEKHRAYAPIRHMKLEDFSRVLEEIGLAAWHGDGRTTTVREIEEHCRTSGLGSLLDDFQEGAKAGVTRLLAAFFFRQYGQRPSGDPTFAFTHKSFGEYLAARRIVRAVEKLVRELDRRATSPDEGWDEKDALKHWILICGPSPLSRYLHVFLLNEMKLRSNTEVENHQKRLAKLFSHMLKHGMPMEQLRPQSFRDALFQSRNAEEALLAVLNVCAEVTQHTSLIEQSDPTTFGNWFKRIQGQRSGPQSSLAASCLSFLDLAHAILDIADFYGANLQHSNLEGLEARYTMFGQANMNNVNLRRSSLGWANLEGVNLEGADLKHADLRGASLRNSNLTKVKVDKTNLQHTIISGITCDSETLSKIKAMREPDPPPEKGTGPS